MDFVIDAAEKGTPLHNFWNNIHFHPTDAVEDMWGKRILDQIAADRSAQYVRLYTMFDDMVSRGGQGELILDFGDQDRRLDYMVSRGFKILLCFNFMPAVMAADPANLSGKRYKDKHFCRSKPADYEEWRILCRKETEHLVGRYGIETVSQWLFHCWNEPDLGFWIYPKFFFECTPEEKEEKIVEYCKLYDFFEAGVHEASPEIRTGGPSCGHNKEFFERVIEHVASGRNFVTGKTGTRIDFVSLHCYSSIPQDVDDPLRYKVCPESIVNQYQTYRAIMGRHGLGRTPAVIDEWAAAAEGYLGIAEDPGCAFAKRSIMRHFTSG